MVRLLLWRKRPAVGTWPPKSLCACAPLDVSAGVRESVYFLCLHTPRIRGDVLASI